MAATLSILLSGSLLALLAWSDPKRVRTWRRARGNAGHTSPLPLRLRRICGGLMLAPGLALAVLGQWWPFLIWLGATCALGWLASQALAIRPPHD